MVYIVSCIGKWIESNNSMYIVSAHIFSDLLDMRGKKLMSMRFENYSVTSEKVKQREVIWFSFN